MSYKNSCNNIAGWDDVYYYSDNSALYSDGVSIRPLATTVSSYEEVYLYLEKYFTEYLSGDFDISLDTSLTNWTPNLDENYQFNIYIYTSDTYYTFELESSQLSNKIIFEGNELSITLPFSDVFRMTRVGNLVTWYVGSTIIKQETITSGFTVEGIDIEWYYEANSASIPVIPTLKINNIEATDSAISSNADLDNPCLSFVDNVNTLNPSWSTSVTSYTCEASYITNSYTMIPFTSDGDATVKVNGNSVPRGEIISSAPLSYGVNYLTTEVTAEDTTTVKTYDITITRRATPLSDSSLASFTCSQTLSPIFSSTTYEYNIEYPYVTPNYVRFIPIKSDKFAVMKKDGQVIEGGEYIYIYNAELILGNIDVTIEITAEDGITVSTYVFHIFQGAPSTVCTLSSLKFNTVHGITSPSNNVQRTLFKINDFAYEVTDLTIYDIFGSIYFTKDNKYSTVYLNGNIINTPNYVSTYYIYAFNLDYGENIIVLTVVAQDGITQNTYTFYADTPLPYQYSYGTGTSLDPFQIFTANDLNGIREYPGVVVHDKSITPNYFSKCFYFKQMANIDLSGYANWECINGDPYIFTSQGWTGYYDGNNFNISNLTINKTLAESTQEGLFKSINFPTNTVGLPNIGNGILEPNNASIKNIHINNASITLTWTESGGALVGILAGSSGCNIFNCTVEGSLNMVSSYTILDGAIGGLTGTTSCGERDFMYRCSANTVITLGGNTGNWKNVGGLIGRLFSPYTTSTSLEPVCGIHECCSEGQIIWDYIPYTGSPNFEGYYNMSTEAPQNEEIGGLIGSAFNTDRKGISFFVVKNCYSTVDVLAYCRNYSGGLFGYCQHPLINCYSSGIVTMAPPHWWSLLSTYFYPTEENVNGSIGKATTTVWDGGIEIPWTQTSSYFDIDIGLLTDSRITQKTTSEMKTQSTFIGWDFENVWSIDSSINDGYPYLQWLPLPIPRMVVYTRCFYL